MNDITCVHHAIVKRHEERGDLEHRSRLAAETDGTVHHLIIPSVAAPFHVHNGFDITRLHLHQDGHAHLTVDLFQFVDDSMLCQILHPNVNGGHHIRSVNRIQHGDVHILIQNFPAMHQTVGSTEDGIVGKFQAILGTILGSKHISDGALGQRSERSAARVELFPMEAAPVFRQREEG